VPGIRTLGYLTLDAPPADTIDAAAAAGFTSVGIRITGRRRADPYAHVVGNRAAIADLRHRAADQGVRLSNISAYHFYPDVTDDDLQRVMETVIALGSGIVVANSYDPDENAYVEKLARYCDAGRVAGVRIAVEFMKYSAVRSIEDARRVIERVGAPNIGLLIDPLHLSRSGGTPADVRALDPGRIVFAQLCDARAVTRAPSVEALRHEARTGRLFPGDGDLPLRDFLSALPADVEIEYEVPRQDLTTLTLAERARVAYSVCSAYLDGPPGGTA